MTLPSLSRNVLSLLSLLVASDYERGTIAGVLQGFRTSVLKTYRKVILVCRNKRQNEVQGGFSKKNFPEKTPPGVICTKKTDVNKPNVCVERA